MDFVWGDKSQSFVIVRGTVANSSKWSETRVSSSGAGSNLQVSSNVTARHEFWVQTADGKQVPVQLTNVDFPLMPGQVVTIVNAPDPKKPNQERWIYVVNHSADQHWTLNAAMDQTAGMLMPMRMWSIAVPLVLLLLSGVSVIFPLAGAGYIGYRLLGRHNELKKVRAALQEHLRSLVPA